MRVIRTVLVDDEPANREMLENLVGIYCPVIEVVGKANSVKEGFELINRVQPDLVFLDIRMPIRDGFDLLKMFSEISFRVIFVTAFDEYAFQAFEFNAIDYVLKPIDPEKLIRSVEKVKKSFLLDNENTIVRFIESIEEKKRLLKTIPLHSRDKVVLVEIDKICYIQATLGYCEVVTEDNRKLLTSKLLSDYEELFKPYNSFIRVNKSVLVNVNYIREYTKGAMCFITISNYDRELEVSRRKKGNVLQYLKGRIGITES